MNDREKSIKQQLDDVDKEYTRKRERMIERHKEQLEELQNDQAWEAEKLSREWRREQEAILDLFPPNLPARSNP